MADYTHISVGYSHHEKIATVTLRRPEAHNAFTPQLVEDLTTAFNTLTSQKQLHGVVLAAEGKSFSAGADIPSMKAAQGLSLQDNIQDALKIADLFRTIAACPCPVVARVQGSAIGGGAGLVAVSDIAIAAEHARFAFSEVKLGIAPATISPYVVRKIGESQARALFLTGMRFDASRAHAIGLVHYVVPSDRLDAMLEQVTQDLLSGGPQALRACKMLAMTVDHMDPTQVRGYTAEIIAQLRVSEEGQEGLSAFLEKRLPMWQAE